jgi:hypothetical protein
MGCDYSGGVCGENGIKIVDLIFDLIFSSNKNLKKQINLNLTDPTRVFCHTKAVTDTKYKPHR